VRGGYAIWIASNEIDVDELSFYKWDILLVFSFLGADNVEKASAGLPLCDTGDDFTCMQSITHQSVGCNHIQTITQLDLDSLLPKKFINDVIVDFWML